MFLSGVLADLDRMPITTGGDEVVARSKGFDEFSFRNTAPGQKKLNRAENKKRKRNNE